MQNRRCRWSSFASTLCCAICSVWDIIFSLVLFKCGSVLCSVAASLKRCAWITREPAGFPKWTHEDLIHQINANIYSCYTGLFKLKIERTHEHHIAAIGCSRLQYFCLLSRWKDWPYPQGRLALQGLSCLDFLLWLLADTVFTALYRGNWLFLPLMFPSQVVPLLCLSYICRSPFGLISSSNAEAAGHSISTLCMLSVPALTLPFFFFSPNTVETTWAAQLAGEKET